MKRKTVVYLLLIFLWRLSLLPLAAGGETIKKDAALLREYTGVEEEIDSLIKEIHKISFLDTSNQNEGKEIPKLHKIINPTQIAQTLIPPQRRKQKMTLNFTQANLEDVVQTIAEAAGVNIILDPALKGKKVDFHLSDTPIEEALSLLYKAYDLGSYQVGNSLFIATREKIKSETLITKIIKLRNISVKELEKLLKDLIPTVNISEETNHLVVVGDPEEVAKAEDIVKRVDIPQPQVILEAKIIEIKRSDAEKLGIDWSDSITTSYQETGRPVSFSDPETSVPSPFRIFRLSRNALQFESIIHMLAEKNRLKILSNPRIVTMNNKEAEIFIGDEVPYTVTTVTGGVATTEVRWVEPGIRLKITPSIIEKDFVVLEVKPEVSTITEFRGPNEEFPQIRTREATAHVRVKNGQPFVMGGLLSQEDRKELSKVPFLGNIPLLGNLFQFKDNSDQETELIITVTPTIVN